mmetsp:Transcript_24021/g.71259  ORF Transcript_24021/g.71259 Transcript_24021/m.71259 type:complete len:235 (+) Transcript_24021:1931-2635(+)
MRQPRMHTDFAQHLVPVEPWQHVKLVELQHESPPCALAHSPVDSRGVACVQPLAKCKVRHVPVVTRHIGWQGTAHRHDSQRLFVLLTLFRSRRYGTGSGCAGCSSLGGCMTLMPLQLLFMLLWLLLLGRGAGGRRDGAAVRDDGRSWSWTQAAALRGGHRWQRWAFAQAAGRRGACGLSRGFVRCRRAARTRTWRRSGAGTITVVEQRRGDKGRGRVAAGASGRGLVARARRPV